MTEQDIAQQLIDGGKILVGEGHGDMTRGHISARLPNDPSRFLMKPHSFGMEEITRDNLVLCNIEGEKIGGGGPRHSEVYIHSEIYRVRPNVNSVIHSHPDYTVAFSALGMELRPISQPSAAFLDGLPVYSDTIDLIRTKEMGAGVAKALGRHRAVLMKNHGVAVVGADVIEAVIMAIMLENACRIQILASSGGKIAPEFPREDVIALQKKITTPDQHGVNFEYLRRKHAPR